MSSNALPGFREFYPDDFAFRAHLFEAFRSVARSYGFEEYDGPPLEPLDLYTAKSGEEIVGQLYHFVDKGDRAVALRPEMTPTLARMVAARANGLRKPIRWFSIPQLFRYERQQRGRLREHFQLNCDLIGEAGPAGDAEIIALAIDIMRRLGLGSTEVRVRLSDRRVLNAILDSLGFPAASHGAAYQFLDKMGRGNDAALQAVLRAAGATEEQVAGLASLRDIKTVDGLARGFPAALEACGPLREIVDILGQMGLADFIDIDLTIVRGLAYYTGPVFELFDAARSLRAICGGGRYDNLLAAIGGVDLPALGFGMGDVVLGELLRERGLAPAAPAAIDLFVAGPDPADRPTVHRLTHQLRDAGWRAEFALTNQNLGKQFKQADARGARIVLVVGEAERARGVVQVKDLVHGGQSEVAEGQLQSVLESILGACRPSSSSPVSGAPSHG
ncbi:MAG: histidine--tRNA ligase [Gemmatimonadota bacterium]|nr:histidine--tRNA ligase [Gemmatimonadota bacterium]